MQIRKLALLLSTLCAAGAALADITVGVSVSATGPAASLGIRRRTPLPCCRSPSPAKR